MAACSGIPACFCRVRVPSAVPNRQHKRQDFRKPGQAPRLGQIETSPGFLPANQVWLPFDPMKYTYVDTLPDCCQVKLARPRGRRNAIEEWAAYAAGSIPKRLLSQLPTEAFCAADGGVGFVLPAGVNVAEIQRFLWNFASDEDKHTPEEYADLMRLSCKWRKCSGDRTSISAA